MTKYKLLIVFIVLLVVITFLLIVINKKNNTTEVLRDDFSKTINCLKSGEENINSLLMQKTMSEFKSNPGNREVAARKILPFIKKGMTKNELLELLGTPSSKDHGGKLWVYSVFYSKCIDVYFNSNGNLIRFDSVGLD